MAAENTNQNTRVRVIVEEKFIFSTADTCEFFQISRETLSAWSKKGAPKAGRGKWDIKALVNWRYDMGGQNESPETRKLKAEADLKEAKAKQEQIKLSVTKTEFISAYEVQKELTRLLANLKKSLLAISHNVASDVGSIDFEMAEFVEKQVDKRISEALKELSEGRLYGTKRKKTK